MFKGCCTCQEMQDFYWCMAVILTRCPFCHHEWNLGTSGIWTQGIWTQTSWVQVCHLHHWAMHAPCIRPVKYYSHSCLTAATLMEWYGWRAVRRTLSTCLQSWRESRVRDVVTRQKAARVFTAALPTPLTASRDDGLSVHDSGCSRMPCASARCRTNWALARNSYSYTTIHTVYS